MGCVCSKREQKAAGKGDHELDHPAPTAHYVKDPTAPNSKGVSSDRFLPLLPGQPKAGYRAGFSSSACRNHFHPSRLREGSHFKGAVEAGGVSKRRISIMDRNHFESGPVRRLIRSRFWCRTRLNSSRE